MQHYKKTSSHPVILLPEVYPIYDLSKPEDITLAEKGQFGIGRYNERRETMYRSPLFQGQQNRNIHMGIDFFAPVNTPIYSWGNGRIFLFGYNDQPKDYGYTLITEHEIGNRTLYALYGHLSRKSILNKAPGQSIRAGDVIAWVGDLSENGGWTPHLHFQLSIEKPNRADMPGVVSEQDHREALNLYPDPRLVLGPVYL